MSTLVMKRGDNQPPFYARLTFTDSGGYATNLDMTGAVVRVKAQGNMPGMPVIDRVAFGDANGNVIMYWEPGDTAVAGTYRAEVEVTFPDSTRVTFPPDGYLLVAIEPDLG